MIRSLSLSPAFVLVLGFTLKEHSNSFAPGLTGSTFEAIIFTGYDNEVRVVDIIRGARVISHVTM